MISERKRTPREKERKSAMGVKERMSWERRNVFGVLVLRGEVLRCNFDGTERLGVGLELETYEKKWLFCCKCADIVVVLFSCGWGDDVVIDQALDATEYPRSSLLDRHFW